MSRRTISGTTKAWLPAHSSLQPLDLTTASDEQIVRHLFFTMGDMSTSDWTLVGQASITVDLPEKSEVIEGAVASLKARKQRVLADAQVSANAIERQIQELQCLEVGK